MEKKFTIIYNLKGSTFNYCYVGMKAEDKKHAFMKFQNLCRRASTRTTVVDIKEEN